MNYKTDFLKSVMCILLCVVIVLFGVFSGDGIALALHSKVGCFLFSEESRSIVPINEGESKVVANTSLISAEETEKKKSSLTETPEDIKKLKNSYKRIYDKSEKSGAITEKKMGATAKTLKYGSVLVDNKTKENISIKNVLSKRPDYKKITKDEPYILIYHTHTTEGYEMIDMGWYSESMNSRTQNKEKNMVRVGDELAKTFEDAGFKVIHDRNIYDESYNGAYERSRVSVLKYLKKYPSIAVTLDVHRDAIHYKGKVKCKPTAIINGKKAAQVMIITGCEGGKVESFPQWQKNLVFSLHLQRNAEDMYPGLMRPVYFSHRKYNMDVTPCSVLLEFGSDANTLEEAVYSARLVGTAMAKQFSDSM